MPPTDKEPPKPDDDEILKRRLLWQKVNSPNFAEESSAKKNIVQKNTKDKTVVPPIPNDLLGGSHENVTEHQFVRKLGINPLVPIGMLATVGCLIGMCKASMQNNSMKAQYYMRGRITAQFLTVCALVGGAAWLGLDPRGYSKPGDIPKKPDALTNLFLKQDL